MLTLSIRMRGPALGLLLILPLAAAMAQQPKGRGPGGGGGMRAMMPSPLVMDDYSGFESIFDGTLKNWDGDTNHWRAEGGVIVGETTADRKLSRNTFLVWRGGTPADFELKLDFRLNSTNSGIQYRSVELPDVGKWVLKGYQADIDYENRYTGQLYEERGRGFLAMRGQATVIEEGKKAQVIANLKDATDLRGAVNINAWNTLHIIARGNTLIHILNGQLTSVAIDNDAKARAMSGLIGFQIHVGPPMKAEFRNIYLKKY
ncbi:MAG: DUF1080 domain-containing protein [Bryobacteraceae bacterium]|nr:DUF1080 domain-containing protein [Bryobacteraceae bacterium]